MQMNPIWFLMRARRGSKIRFDKYATNPPGLWIWMPSKKFKIGSNEDKLKMKKTLKVKITLKEEKYMFSRVFLGFFFN